MSLNNRVDGISDLDEALWMRLLPVHLVQITNPAAVWNISSRFTTSILTEEFHCKFNRTIHEIVSMATRAITIRQIRVARSVCETQIIGSPLLRDRHCVKVTSCKFCV